MGQSESLSEEDLDVTPEVTRELLASLLRLLMKSRAVKTYVKQGSLKPVIVTRQADPPFTIIAQPPCSGDQHHDAIEAVSNDAEAEPNGRRAVVTTATRVEANPYTGQLHYVHYPVIYPTVKTYVRPIPYR
jgi:hypothetical protein